MHRRKRSFGKAYEPGTVPKPREHSFHVKRQQTVDLVNHGIWKELRKIWCAANSSPISDHDFLKFVSQEGQQEADEYTWFGQGSNPGTPRSLWWRRNWMSTFRRLSWTSPGIQAGEWLTSLHMSWTWLRNGFQYIDRSASLKRCDWNFKQNRDHDLAFLEANSETKRQCPGL
jgi:hypothetical protein